MLLNNVIVDSAHQHSARRAIAELFYEADPCIYPYWFQDAADPLARISAMIDDPSSLFYWERLYVAIHRPDRRIVGLVATLDSTAQLSLQHTDSFNHNFVIDRYVTKVAEQARNVGSNGVIISAFSVHPDSREQGIGRYLLNETLERLRAQGKQRFKLDCPEDNPAISLYHRLGFKDCASGFGFGGGPFSERPVIHTLVLEN